MSKFVEQIREARQAGRLPRWFRGADLRIACPGWARKTYFNFLPKHRVGNPGGKSVYFVQGADGMYRLIDEPMSTDPHRDTVKARLETIGYPAPQEIPEGTEDSADLYACLGDDDAILIEVKSRVEDLDVAKALRESGPGEYIPRNDPVERTDPISRIVTKAVSQLRASQHEYPGHPVLWFIPDPLLGLASANLQMKNGLLGIRLVSFHSVATTKDWSLGHAYFAGRTDFHKFPMLAGAVVDSDGGSELLANPYYTPSDQFASTRLYQYFEQLGAAVNIHAMESDPERQLFVVRGDFDRTDANVLAYLTEKHPGLVFQFVDMRALGGRQSF